MPSTRILCLAALPSRSMRLRDQAVLRLAALTPAPLARRISALQFRLPALRRMITSATAGLVGERVVISGGAAEGLSIAALDTNLGYRIGTTEPALQQFLVSTLAPGDVFYDVGANVGFFSLIGSRLVGSSGKVVAVEPLPAAAELLRGNLEANGFTQAIAVQAAIGAAHGSGTMELGRSSLDGRLSTGSDGPRVEIVSVDHGVEVLGWPLPSVIKLDVEGAEVSAIAGMQRTAVQCHPILLIEVHWCRAAVLDALHALGYRAEPFGDVDILAADGEVHGMLLARSAKLSPDEVPPGSRSRR